MKCLYRGLKPRLKSTFASLMIFALLFSFLGAISPATAAAATPADSLIVNIDNNGETTTVHTYTLAEMEALSGEDIVYYSSIDSMPAPVLTIARGVTLSSLVQDLNEKHNANITLSPDTLKSIKLHATDGWSATYSYDYLFGAPRNYYPQLVSCWDENSGLTGPGSDADPVALEPMFAVSSFQGRFLTDLDPGKMIGPGEEGSTTFRFCFGQTAVELANTMPTAGRFGKYIWKMDIVMDIAPPESLPAPELTADSTDNTVGQAIDITFTDDESWRETITGITVDGNALDSEQYTVTAGKINIAAGVFTEAKKYEIIVKANGYNDAVVTQNMEADTLSETPPELIADTLGCYLGQAVTLEFYDNANWRSVITNVIVNDNVLSSNRYRVDPGAITINADVFTASGDFAIVVKATGYQDANLTQTMHSMVVGNLYPIAGKGTSDDGRAAVRAGLKEPKGLAVDSDGSLYIADWANQCIRKVTPSGIITTPAGIRTVGGYDGDGGPATSAKLSRPFGVATKDGSLYIADRNNSCIRKVDRSGIITTVPGTTGFGWLNGIAFDNAGNLYIATEGNRILKKDTSGTVTTIAGDGTPAYDGDGDLATNSKLKAPGAVTVDSAGNVYIADTRNQCIRKIDTNGIITTVAGSGQKGYDGDGGPATDAKLNYPSGVAVDSVGNIYFGEMQNNCVRKVDTNGTITTVAEGLSRPTHVAVGDLDNLYISSDGGIYFLKVAATNLDTPPTLNADTADNIIGQPVTITFTDNSAWRTNITGVSVNGDELTPDRYTIEAEKITINSDAFTVADHYLIRVKATGYTDASVIQPIHTGDLLFAPELTVDTSDNTVGQPVNIGFTDNEAWREAISAIKVNDIELNNDQYTISAGNINIATAVFTTARAYTITVQANGYIDATANVDMAEAPPRLTVTIDDNGDITTKVYLLSELEQMEIGKTRVAYTAVDNLPAPNFMAAEGILFEDLLELIGVPRYNGPIK